MKKKWKKKNLFKSIKNKISKALGLPFGNNVGEVLEHKMEKGNKELVKAKKGIIKQFNPKIIQEFDKLAKNKANKSKTELNMYEDLLLKKKVIENIKKLIHPFKTSKKKKEIEVLFPKK